MAGENIAKKVPSEVTDIFLYYKPSKNRKILGNLDLKSELKTPESRCCCQVFFGDKKCLATLATGQRLH